MTCPPSVGRVGTPRPPVMRLEEYATLRRAEDNHWWYRSLRSLVAKILAEHVQGRGPIRLLDAGCGTGGGAARWQAALPAAACAGIDLEPEALRYCR